jgi:hypothetical protein
MTQLLISMLSVADPGCLFRIPDPTTASKNSFEEVKTYSGSRIQGQKGTGSRIRIRNIVYAQYFTFVGRRSLLRKYKEQRKNRIPAIVYPFQP